MKQTRRQFGQTALAAFATTSLPAVGKLPILPDRLIDPLIGASTSQKLGEGKTFPGPTTPFGMVQIGPDTITGGDNAPGYSYEHTTIEGFSYTRMSGVGWFGDFGNLLTMPMLGGFKPVSGRPGRPGEGWRSRFSHATEIAECGYYAVTLEDTGIRAELTATAHAGFMQFTFPQSREARIQIDLARRIGGTSTRQHCTVINDHTIEGWVECLEASGGWGNGLGHVNYTLFFCMEFSKAFAGHGIWSIELPLSEMHSTPLIADYFQSDAYYAHAAQAKLDADASSTEGDHIGFYAVFNTAHGEKIRIKTGISFVSVEGARNNLAHEIPDWDFAAIRLQNRNSWSIATDKIKISGGTPAQNKIFETALYHCMIDPRKIADVNGRYRAADGKIAEEKDFNHRTIFSGWDVFRTHFPLMTIIDPTLVSDTISTLVELSQVSGKGYLERWEIMGAYSGCMDGDPALSVIADAYVKGIRNFDVDRAYAACKQSASATGERTGRPQNGFYLDYGYVPDQISWTLDNAYFDWCVGAFAKALNKPAEANAYFKRSGNYANIYDPSVGWMRARDSDGKPIPWQGETAFGQGCTESNPLQQSWFVPHDVDGLIKLMGEEAFTQKLEALFDHTPDTFGWNPYYNHSNEPVHHIPYLFNYVGKPWLTQKWVRRILNQAYGPGVAGICGNDDVGQMSAWYVMSALGFYPVCPGTTVYVLGSPLFPRTTIALDPQWHKGKSFSVIAHNNSAANFYVQSVKLNGTPLLRSWITHEEVTSGGVLEFEMGSQPNMAWGVRQEHRPPSAI